MPKIKEILELVGTIDYKILSSMIEENIEMTLKPFSCDHNKPYTLMYTNARKPAFIDIFVPEVVIIVPYSLNDTVQHKMKASYIMVDNPKKTMEKIFDHFYHTKLDF